MKTMIRFFTLFITCLCALACHSKADVKLSSDEVLKTTVYYAGFGFLGASKDIKDRLPHAYRISKIKEKGVSKLTHLLTKQVEQTEFAHLDIRFGLVDQNTRRPLMMALSVESEEFTKIGTEKVAAELIVQTLFFDYKSGSLVDTKYIHIAHDAHIGKGTIDKKKLYDKAYLNTEEGIIPDSVNLLKNYKVKENNGLRFKVNSVTLTKKFLKYTPTGLDKEKAQDFFGLAATAAFSRRGLNMIPFVKGATIGGQMAFTLANANEYSIKLPEADFEWDIFVFNSTVKAMPKRKDEHTVYMQVRLQNKVSGARLLDILVKRKVEVYRPKNPTLAHRWQVEDDAIRLALQDLAEQIYTPSAAWCKESSNGKETCKTIRQLSETIFKQ